MSCSSQRPSVNAGGSGPMCSISRLRKLLFVIVESSFEPKHAPKKHTRTGRTRGGNWIGVLMRAIGDRDPDEAPVGSAATISAVAVCRLVCDDLGSTMAVVGAGSFTLFCSVAFDFELVMNELGPGTLNLETVTVDCAAVTAGVEDTLSTVDTTSPSRFKCFTMH